MLLEDYLARRSAEFYFKADTTISDKVFTYESLKRPRPHVDEILAALAAAGFHGYTFAPMQSQGTFHLVYECRNQLGHRLVLRLNTLSDVFVDWQIKQEHTLSQFLRAQGIEHPKIHFSDCTRNIIPFDFQVRDFVVGRSLKELDDEEEAFVRQLPGVATYLSRLHQIKGDGFGLVHSYENEALILAGLNSGWDEYLNLCLDEHLDTLERSLLISSPERNKVIFYFKEAQSALKEVDSRLLHGDCGSQNIFISECGNISLIDWEDALFGDPLFEVASWAAFNPPRRWKAFFQAYFESDWEPGFLFWHYFLRIALCRTIVRLRFGYKDIPGRSKASLRIQLALQNLSALH